LYQNEDRYPEGDRKRYDELNENGMIINNRALSEVEMSEVEMSEVEMRLMYLIYFKYAVFKRAENPVSIILKIIKQ
jgi:hypothetical protein